MNKWHLTSLVYFVESVQHSCWSCCGRAQKFGKRRAGGGEGKSRARSAECTAQFEEKIDAATRTVHRTLQDTYNAGNEKMYLYDYTILWVTSLSKKSNPLFPYDVWSESHWDVSVQRLMYNSEKMWIASPRSRGDCGVELLLPRYFCPLQS